MSIIEQAVIAVGRAILELLLTLTAVVVLTFGVTCVWSLKGRLDPRRCKAKRGKVRCELRERHEGSHFSSTPGRVYYWESRE